MKRRPQDFLWSIGVSCLLITMGSSVTAQEFTYDKEGVTSAFQAPGYSPYARTGLATQVYFGDTHLHTSLSLDARAFGVLMGPADAYRFARGEEVTSTHGLRVRLSRPLDFLVVADHSDALGVMNEIIAGNSLLMRDQTIRRWNRMFNAGGDEAFTAAMETIGAFTQGVAPEITRDENLFRSIWQEVAETADV